jgi:para-nitrobenzyl esterase
MTKHSLIMAAALAACGGGSSGSPDGRPPDDATPDAPRCPVTAGAPGERVSTTSGVAHGTRAGATWSYKAIPFAAPPVGDLRFRAPERAACADSEIDATAFGPRCPQLDSGAYAGSEDCLQLNVWAPAATAAPRPVMFWIHGGGNSVGTAADALYDGRRLSEVGDVVLVSANYRLGQLGFLAHPSFGTGSGNFGTLDLVQALGWVHDNIAAFGGDPGNVTIFGESAGARDVCTLLAAQPAAGLFHRAIMESGACKFLPTRSAAEAQGNKVVAATSCAQATDVPACLRALPVATLINALAGDPGALGSSPYQPTIDGSVLVEQPSVAMTAGRHHAVPFLVGANADETGKVAPAVPSETAYQDLVHAQYGTTLGDRVLQQYPASRFATPRAAYVRVTTDSRFVCPAREIARAADAGQTAAVYRYLFQYAGPSQFGVVHGLDVPFVFGTFDALLTAGGQPYQPTATDLAVSATIQTAWTTFARTGVPATTPAWPVWTPTDPTLQLDASLSVADGIRTADCDFWRPLYDAL